MYTKHRILIITNSIKTNIVTDKSNSQNETWHWTNNEIEVAVQSLLWVRVELMARQLNQLQHQNRIQWWWIQIPLRPTFYSCWKEYFGGKYHIYSYSSEKAMPLSKNYFGMMSSIVSLQWNFYFQKFIFYNAKINHSNHL